MADDVRRYLDARKDYDTATRKLNDLIGMVRNVAKCLSRDPMKFMFSDTSPGLPAEVVLSDHTRSVKGTDWPSAEQIQTALARLHDSKEQVKTAWMSLSVEDRAGMQPPETPSRRG